MHVHHRSACSLPTNGWMSDFAARPLPPVLLLTSSIGIDLCIDLCFGLDMVLSFNTSHFSDVDQALIHSRRLVARKYVSGWMIIDLASTVPIDKLVSTRVARRDYLCVHEAPYRHPVCLTDKQTLHFGRLNCFVLYGW